MKADLTKKQQVIETMDLIRETTLLCRTLDRLEGFYEDPNSNFYTFDIDVEGRPMDRIDWLHTLIRWNVHDIQGYIFEATGSTESAYDVGWIMYGRFGSIG